MRLDMHPVVKLHFPKFRWQTYLGLYVCVIAFFSTYQSWAQQLSSKHLSDSSVNYALTKGMFSVDLVALNYRLPAKNKYAYYLSGFDKQWTYAGNQRRVSYTNLDPGTYTFHVIASNNNGEWNRVGKKLVISILPPWYMTWWAYTIFVIALILISYCFATSCNWKSHFKRILSQLKNTSELIPNNTYAKPYSESLAGKVTLDGITHGAEHLVNTADEVSDADSLVSTMPVMLVIDGDEQMRNYLRKIFHHIYKFYEASSGQHGLAMAKELLPDIILSDVKINDMNGIKLCEYIKQDAITNHIPVLLLTSNAEDENKWRGIEAGAADVITKPFDNEALTLRIKGILHDRECMQKHFFDGVTMKLQTRRISENDKHFLYNCEDVIEQHILDPTFELQLIADSLGITYTTLYKKIKIITGQTVNGFVRHVRLRKAAELMIQTNCNVNEAAFNTGFNDIKYFREQFQKQFGTRPSDYIRKHRHAFSSSLLIK